MWLYLKFALCLFGIFAGVALVLALAYRAKMTPPRKGR